MAQRGSEACLAAKPSNVGFRALGVEALDGDVAAQDAVLGQEYGRRSSRAEPALDTKAIGQHYPRVDLSRHLH
jgi:hypothetical protein